ncbi:hypothetical protein IJ732_07940 [bacterium]|nr:hypothetical protein [bacterium]
MLKIRNFFFFIITICLSIQICFAKEPVELSMELPANFPTKNPFVGNYIMRSNIHVFFKKWAESILATDNSVNVKFLDKKYKGIGSKTPDEFFYNPLMTIPGSNYLSCPLYRGLANKNAYIKLKSPILYDSKNNICVAIIGYRDYNPQFTEPGYFEEIVYVFDPFFKDKNYPLVLQELVLVPSSIKSNKKEQKYLNNINKLYYKTFNKVVKQNTFLNTVGDFFAFIITLPLVILMD